MKERLTTRGSMDWKRRTPKLAVLSFVGFAAALAAIPLTSNQGSDLHRLVVVLASYFGLLLTAALALRLAPGSRARIEEALERCVSVAGERLHGRRAGIAVLSMMAIYAVVWSGLSILRHNGLNSCGFDLAIQHQVIWNLAHGRGFSSSIEVSNYLGDHVGLTMPLFVPWLWVWDDVRSLLIAQSVVLCLGAWPIYRIARRWFGPVEGVVWAGVYLLTPALGFMNKYDFHDVVMAIPLLLAGIDALDEGRIGFATIFMALAAATREEVAIAVAAIAVWQAIGRKRWIWGGTVAVLAFGWAFFALYWVIPHFRGGAESDTIARYAWLGTTPGKVIRTLLTSPWVLFTSHYHRLRRAIFPIQLIWPTAGLPLLAPGVAIVAAPSFALSFASSNVSQPSIYFQYNAPILPILFWAALEGARRRRRSGGSRGWMLAGLLFSLPSPTSLIPRR